MFQLSTSFEDGKKLESIPGLYLGSKSDTDMNIELPYNYYFGFQIWNLDFWADYNRRKLTIRLL